VYTIFFESHFAASHQLHGYQGECKDLHGHTWKVRVEINSSQTNDIGISIDFRQLKEITRSVLELLDHRHINEVPPFDQINPTAENLSKFIYESVKAKLPDSVQMSRVTVWESAQYGITYSEQIRDQSQ